MNDKEYCPFALAACISRTLFLPFGYLGQKDPLNLNRAHTKQVNKLAQEK